MSRTASDGHYGTKPAKSQIILVDSRKLIL